jgi:hypothetical protein
MARESLHTAEALSMRLKEFIALAQQHPLHAGQSSTSVQ